MNIYIDIEKIQENLEQRKIIGQDEMKDALVQRFLTNLASEHNLGDALQIWFMVLSDELGDKPLLKASMMPLFYSILEDIYVDKSNSG